MYTGRDTGTTKEIASATVYRRRERHLIQGRTEIPVFLSERSERPLREDKTPSTYIPLTDIP